MDKFEEPLSGVFIVSSDKDANGFRGKSAIRLVQANLFDQHQKDLADDAE